MGGTPNNKKLAQLHTPSGTLLMSQMPKGAFDGNGYSDHRHSPQVSADLLRTMTKELKAHGRSILRREGEIMWSFSHYC